MKKFIPPEKIRNYDIFVNYTIGLVIPVYQKKYISNLLKQITKTVSRKDYCICIVNDGNEAVEKYLEKQNLPANVEILNLTENRGFAAANNLGWKYLTSKFPSINYLGTINDDTIPRNGWLEITVNALEENPKLAIAAPIQEVRKGWFGKKDDAIFKLGNAHKSWIPVLNKITRDTFVPAVSGFCFVANRTALEDVNYFEEIYMNSGEDLDICLKLITNGWRILVCKDARVFHYAGSSRYLSSAKVNWSEKIITERWGYDLDRYNKLVIE